MKKHLITLIFHKDSVYPYYGEYKSGNSEILFLDNPIDAAKLINKKYTINNCDDISYLIYIDGIEFYRSCYFDELEVNTLFDIDDVNYDECDKIHVDIIKEVKILNDISKLELDKKKKQREEQEKKNQEKQREREKDREYKRYLELKKKFET